MLALASPGSSPLRVARSHRSGYLAPEPERGARGTAKFGALSLNEEATEAGHDSQPAQSDRFESRVCTGIASPRTLAPEEDVTAAAASAAVVAQRGL
jgi:hypothetical protein